ncbi:MAG: tryptophan--tRNA ligase [Actinobacteria bacterium]|nr:tryptophan--tRNA ligase [Actinomycetota bacterium]
MPRVFSGIQPTGDLHLGNLLGAVRNWVQDQHVADSFYCVVDLHALTVPKEPGEVGRSSLEMAQTLLACGLDPDVCTLFVQSHVREHSELAWLIQCVTSIGELRRMTQFKDKADKQDFVSAGLFTYPALQAADILLYDTDRVPVGEDQRQHIELTRDVAERFNARYGNTFVIPEATVPRAGARVMDLQVPTDKMSKSADSDAGVVYLMEDLAATARKFKRAVTDSDGDVRFDPATKPGVSNLLSILGAVTDRSPEDLADEYTQYGPLKSDTADAVVEVLRPIQERFAELVEDPTGTGELLAIGAEKATAVASDVYRRAVDQVGLLPRV